MGFNLLSALAGGVQGAAMGANPVAIGAGALAGGFAGNGATTVGGFSNGAQNLINGGYLGATEALNAQQMIFQLQLQGQSQQFDQMASERSELLRETNTLRDVAMQQRKADNQIVKEFIRTIG
jgi:urease accessory protein UreF